MPLGRVTIVFNHLFNGICKHRISNLLQRGWQCGQVFSARNEVSEIPGSQVPQDFTEYVLMFSYQRKVHLSYFNELRHHVTQVFLKFHIEFLPNSICYIITNFKTPKSVIKKNTVKHQPIWFVRFTFHYSDKCCSTLYFGDYTLFLGFISVIDCLN